MNIDVYTDGSCLNGYGGYAFIILQNNEIIFSSKNSQLNTTNNQMELEAIIQALEKLLCLQLQNSHITLFSDSQYGVRGITQWIHNWHRNNWQSSCKSPVKNKTYWVNLYDLQQQFTDLTFQWIYGHNGNKYNEQADKLARAACLELYNNR